MDKKPKFFKHEFKLTWSQIIMGCAAMLIGLVLLIWPGIASAALLNGIGIILIIAGTIQVVRYFRADAHAAIIANDLSLGLILIIAGILVISLKGLLISLIPVFFGLIVLIGGIVKVQGALDFKRMNISRWYIELICAIISIVLGVLILFNPFSTALLLMRVIGVALIVEGILDMSSKIAYEKAKSSFFVETKFK